jgi:hypothetical protein
MKGTLLIDELQNYVELVIIFAFIIRVEWDQMLIVLHVQMNGSLLTRHHLLSQVSYPDTIQNYRKLLGQILDLHLPLKPLIVVAYT